MNLALARFDENTRESFYSFYNKIADTSTDAQKGAKSDEKSDQTVPF
jgi:hypothetical protein